MIFAEISTEGWALIITTAGTVVVGIVVAVGKVMIDLNHLKNSVNGMKDSLVTATAGKSRAEGKEEGVKGEQDRMADKHAVIVAEAERLTHTATDAAAAVIGAAEDSAAKMLEAAKLAAKEAAAELLAAAKQAAAEVLAAANHVRDAKQPVQPSLANKPRKDGV